MEKKIKTREVINNIKVHNAAFNFGDGMKNIGIKTKEKISENIEPNDNTSPELPKLLRLIQKKSVVKSPVKPRPRLKKNAQRKRKPLKIRLMIER